MKFSVIFCEMIEKNGVNLNKISVATGLSSGLLCNYRKGKEIPSSKNLCILADYFNVSVDYLLGREKPTIPPENFTAQEQEFIFQFRKLSLSEQADVAKKLYKNGEK